MRDQSPPENPAGGRLPLLSPDALAPEQRALGRVPQGRYEDAVGAFGVEAVIALVNLVGQYRNIVAILACFQVPAPPST